MSSKLYVGSLSWGVDTEKLRRAFEPFGQITDAIVMMERNDPTRSRGFGFVTFADPQSAERAKAEMNGQDVEGRRIRVDISEAKGDGNDRSRGGYDNNQGSGGYNGGYADRSRGGYDNNQHDRSRGGYDNNQHDRSRGGFDNNQGSGRYNGGRDRYDDRRRDDTGGRDRSDAYNRNDSDRYGRDNYQSTERDQNRDDLTKNKTGGGGEAMRDPQSDNNRIYITGLPPSATEESIAKFFGQIGVVARKKQRRGFPDQWPYKVSIYMEDGKPKGDGTVTYEDPNAAQSAPEFFNGADFEGSKLTVELAKEKDPSSQPRFGGGRGGGRGGRGGRYGGGRGGRGGYGGGGRYGGGRGGYNGGGGGRGGNGGYGGGRRNY